MVTLIWVNIGSANGLLPDSTKPWTNVDLSSVRSSGIHLRAILQEILQPSVTEISWKITSKFSLKSPKGQWVKLQRRSGSPLAHGWLLMAKTDHVTATHCTITILALKQKCQFDENTFQCIQWWKCHQNDIIFISVSFYLCRISYYASPLKPK